MTVSKETLSLIEQAKESVLSANNGYAFIGLNESVAAALQRDGFVVIKTTNLHGNKEYKAFSQRAQEALKKEHFAVPTYKSFSMPMELPDYEAMILSKQAKHLD